MNNLTLTLVIATILLSGCSLSPCGFSKDQFIQKHSALVKEAKKNKKSWTAADWKSRDDHMKQMVEECYENYEDELSGKEVGEFWAGTASYYFNRHGKGFLGALKNSERDLSDALKKGLSSLDKNKEGMFKEWLNENLGEDIEKTLDDVGEELKDLGKEIKEWLEE